MKGRPDYADSLLPSLALPLTPVDNDDDLSCASRVGVTLSLSLSLRRQRDSARSLYLDQRTGAHEYKSKWDSNAIDDNEDCNGCDLPLGHQVG